MISYDASKRGTETCTQGWGRIRGWKAGRVYMTISSDSIGGKGLEELAVGVAHTTEKSSEQMAYIAEGARRRLREREEQKERDSVGDTARGISIAVVRSGVAGPRPRSHTTAPASGAAADHQTVTPDGGRSTQRTRPSSLLYRTCTVHIPFICISSAVFKSRPPRRPPRPLSGVVQRTYDWDVGLEPSEGATNISSSM